MKDDLISKAAAIDAVEEIPWYHQNKNGEMVQGANSREHQAWYKADDIYHALYTLPSAQLDMETLIGLAIAVAKPIEALDLSVRSYNALHRIGINSVAEVFELKRNGRLMKIRNIGKKSVDEIEYCLSQYMARLEGGQE